MTNKDYNFLKLYEEHFTTAVKSSFCRNLTRSVLETMNEIYERLKGTSHHMNYNCGACQLDLVKKLGKIYFMEKEMRAIKEKDKEE